MSSKRKAHTLTSREMEILRHDAFTYFTLDTDCISLDAMAQVPPYNQVGKTRLKKWADEDSWLVARQNNLMRWRKLVEEKVGQSLVAQKVTQLEQMHGLWNQGLTLVSNQQLKANSWEGAVGAMTRLADCMDRWRESLVGQSIPMEGQHPGPQQGTVSVTDTPAGLMPVMSPEEARAAAHMILRQRRHGPDTAAPEPAVVEGEASAAAAATD